MIIIRTRIVPWHLREMNLPHGWGNGYVGVPPKHPWFEKHYNDINIEIDHDIHGSLTFSNYMGDNDVSNPCWWVGFDTGHWADNETIQSKQYVMFETGRLAGHAVSALNQAQEVTIEKIALFKPETLTHGQNALTLSISALRNETQPKQNGVQTMAKYNGHKNYNHYNVSLWINNDKSLYHLALQCVKAAKNKPEAAEMFLCALRNQNISHTPDGVPYTKTTILAALRAF